MRVTKKDIQEAFARAFPPDRRASNVGGDGPGYDNRHNIGRLFLDYNPTYGGWMIKEYVGGTSGMGSAERDTFGSLRKSSKEMLAWLDGYIEAVLAAMK